MDTLRTEDIQHEFKDFQPVTLEQESLYRFTKTDHQTEAVFVVDFKVDNQRLGWFECEVFDHGSQRTMLSALKSKGFRAHEQFLKGDFITTVFDNGKYIVEQKYQVIDNPKGKGQIPNYKYYCYEKMGAFDTMNGVFEATKMHHGKQYVAERKTVKNGVLNGEYFYYYPNGNVQRKEQYQNGRLSGLSCDYDSTGRLIHSCTYSWNWRYGMEKWYDNAGKVQRSVQWQRDKKSGTEKVTLAGKTILQVTYKNGVANGTAIFPFNEYPFSTRRSDTLNTLPVGIEKVSLKNGLKDGAFVALTLDNKDTLATGFYVNNAPDSVWRVYHNGVLGLEKTYIDSVPSIASTWKVTTGEHKGQAAKIEIQNRATNSTYIAQRFEPLVEGDVVKWKEHYYEARDSAGYLVGTFRDEVPHETYTKGKYINGLKHGQWLSGATYGNKDISSEINYEYGILHGYFNVNDSTQTIIGRYNNGQKDSVWTTVTALLKRTEHFEKDKLVGETVIETSSGIQRLFYDNNRLIELAERRFKGDSIRANLLSISDEFVTISYQEWVSDTLYRLMNYAFPRSEISDTSNPLIELTAHIQTNRVLSINYLNGVYEEKTPSYALTGTLQALLWTKTTTVHHLNEGIEESITHNTDKTTRSYYTKNKTVFSGTFHSMFTHEKIRVRKGVRQGWSEVYAKDGILIQRVKYSNGFPVKSTNKPALVDWTKFLFWK